jgi:hypothetical protein
MRLEVPNKEPWRAAFDMQATSTLLDKVHRATRARMRTYAGRSNHVSAEDIDDMMMGVINRHARWDARVGLPPQAAAPASARRGEVPRA